MRTVSPFPTFAPADQKPTLRATDVLALIGIGLNLLLVVVKGDVPRLAYIAPIGFLAVVGLMSFGPLGVTRIRAWQDERVRFKALLACWPGFRDFQHRLHDLLRSDRSRGLTDALRNLHPLECRGKPEEITREIEQKFRLFYAYTTFATEQVARFITEAQSTPRSYAEARQLAWGFQSVFTSLDQVGIIAAFLAARTTVGQEQWYAEWFDRFKVLVLDYQTFADKATRNLKDNVFWIHVRVA